MKPQQVQEVLKKFSSVFDTMKLSQAAFQTWSEILAKYDDELVWKAAREVIETNQYAPKPSDVIGAIKRLKGKGPSGFYSSCSPAEISDYNARLKPKGIVKTDSGYCPVRYAHGSESKIDYCMRILGAKSVNAMLREHLHIKGKMFTNIDPKQYMKFLDEVLVPMAEADGASAVF